PAAPFQLAMRQRPRADVPSSVTEPWIFWDGQATLHGVAFQTGVPWEGVTGVIACRGEHKDGQLGCLKGGIWLGQAALYRQPVRDVRAGLSVDPKQPDWLSIPYLSARVFGGDVGGEARVRLGEPL